MGNNWWSIAFTGLAVLGWEWAVRFWQIPRYILPAPTEVAAALWQALPLLVEHTRFTLAAAGAGFAVGSAAGMALALAMDRSPLLYRAVYPLILVSQTIPIIFIAPLLVIWFGYGLLPKVVVAALVGFFPVAISFHSGLAAADPEIMDLLKTMGAGQWTIMRIVKIPGALPSLFAGLRISATYGIMAAVIGEWLGASKGLGVFMTRASHSFLVDRVFAAILVVSVLSVGVVLLVNTVQRLVMPWYFRQYRAD